MANRQRGEASFKTATGEEITLAIDFDALAEAEDQADTPVPKLLEGLSKGRFKAIRAIVFGATRRHNPELTLDAVGDMLLSADAAALTEALGRAASAAFPAPAASAEGKAKAQPKRGTGPRSKRIGPAKG